MDHQASLMIFNLQFPRIDCIFLIFCFHFIVYKMKKIILYIWSSYDPVIPLREIPPRKMRTYVHRKTCTWSLCSIGFTATLFIIVNHQNIRSPSTGKWIDKLWIINKMECYVWLTGDIQDVLGEIKAYCKTHKLWLHL